LQLDTVNKDPDEVLKSFDTSFLVITGNGTHLAPWDAKLGFQQLPFIATLNSMTPDGGLVVMASIEVQNVFPIQYVETLPSGEREMWSEEEEMTERDRWEVCWCGLDRENRDGIDHSIRVETKGG
jgi:breast cancer 2 susceptibility protein